MKGIEWYGKAMGLSIALIYFLFFNGNDLFEYISFGLILLTVGIPHGAIDHLLISPKIDTRGLVKFLAKYIIIILLYLVVWIYLPLLALIAFLIMSAFHFGQSHFIEYELSVLKKSTYLFLGIYYLSIILYGDFAYTKSLLESIINIENFEGYGIAIMSFSFLVSHILIAYNQPSKVSYFIVEAVVLGFVLYHLPLLLGFIIYFGFWHALPSMNEEYRVLRKFLGQNAFYNFVKKLMPFTAISLAGIWILMAIFYHWMSPNELILFFFILISLISAPHIWFMNRFLENKNP
ncbi:MAG: beta-carotene 15,15'-monooxygenase [Mongoliibacter sp.]|uniref:Brp/Blh family beta-carotene 15,15'-dioxygenase n=1 Tax=Mongoliibacter sp. TaxID=2022438 RepID=UPI0012F2F521|nr:Brp/Blh family beta-carotene 15,15'-dioxygenase [Mongoliibacter sp.]TVP43169.1 MAG: beta-carotene 15,15'-monooxygenase [Mongoliibacter sp.]